MRINIRISHNIVKLHIIGFTCLIGLSLSLIVYADLQNICSEENRKKGSITNRVGKMINF